MPQVFTALDCGSKTIQEVEDWLAAHGAPKMHALVDAPGNPIGFFLTGGEAHDLFGADLLPTMEIDTLIADEAFGADARVFEPLAAVIPAARLSHRIA